MSDITPAWGCEQL